ncbi:polysaccharide biosynthesis protein, partial [Candidatus Margulisiibacteriota bacterium]
MISLLEAVGLSSMFLAVALLIFGKVNFPYRVLIIDAIFCFMFIGGIRLVIRLWKEAKTKTGEDIKSRNILIVGAGDAGEMIAREMLRLPHLGYVPIGFVDDNPEKTGEYIHKLPILGNTSEISRIVEKYDVAEIIIALPSATGKEIRHIVDTCEKSTATYRIVPGVYELIDGTVHVNQIRNVRIEDLLGREPISVNLREIASYLSGSIVLVTGAGGSIGSELCRQVSMYQPSELILFGRGENSIFNIEYELRKKYPFLNLKVIIGNIRDFNKIDYIFSKHKPSIIFHAAAHKHVSLMETNPEEAVLNNIIGTKILVDAADKYQAKEFVNISTDKAVNPSSIMGSAKKVAEMIVQAKALDGSKTKFVSVRFGNVLESRGSVVPLFKKQITEGGPLTVTHPEARRYFMTIPEAVQLVIQAGAIGKGGEVFILDMGEPVKILDLAKDLIRLSGLEIGRDIEIQLTGLRPGEKLFEEILTASEGTQATKHKK